MTCAAYAEYLAATAYRPTDPYNWLTGWDVPPGSAPTPPPAWADKPVTHISLTEARLYCTWAGKRLPHMYEWQYAAQGTDGRLYPWGDTLDPSRFPTRVSTSRLVPPLANVSAHPHGQSVFGVRPTMS